MFTDWENGFGRAVADAARGEPYYDGRTTTADFKKGYYHGWQWFQDNDVK